MKSVEPFWLVTIAMVWGGSGRLSSASNNMFGTYSFGVGPMDQPGNWQS
jgi:hypothetical protein